MPDNHNCRNVFCLSLRAACKGRILAGKSASQKPRSKLTGHQTCNAAELRGIDPCGSRQMCMQACPPGSLPAEIKVFQE